MTLAFLLNLLRSRKRCHSAAKRPSRNTSYRKYPTRHSSQFIAFYSSITILELQFLRPTLSHVKTDVQLPPAVETLLGLGNKAVLPCTVSCARLASALHDFGRRLAWRAWHNLHPQPSAAPRGIVRLHTKRLPVTHWPPNEPHHQTIRSWIGKTLKESLRRMERQKRVRSPRFVNRAMDWLRENHQAGLVLKIDCDKGYGPAVVPSNIVANEMRRERHCGLFQSITNLQFVEKMCALHFEFMDLMDFAVQNRIIDSHTKKFLEVQIAQIPVRHPPEHVLNWLMERVGRTRYMLKAHKPGRELRRIEVDLRSPLSHVATFVDEILGDVLRRNYPSTLQDSKQVLALVEREGLRPAHDTTFLQVDLVDFFNRIKLAPLRTCLQAVLLRYLRHVPTVDFVAKLLRYILDTKVLLHGKDLVQKADSLSTGERIATNAANLYREEVFGGIMRRHRESGALEHSFGYVDDGLLICHPPYPGFTHQLMEELNTVDAEQFVWTHKETYDSVDFLDLTLQKSPDFEVSGKIWCRLYRKPHWHAQFLHKLSFHAPAVARGIYAGEATRTLLCSTRVEDYDRDLKILRDALRARGYGWKDHIPYDAERRACLIDKYYGRHWQSPLNPSDLFRAPPTTVPVQRRLTRSSVLPLKIPYFPGFHNLRLSRRVGELKRELEEIAGPQVLRDTTCLICHPVSGNIFQKTYALNFPCR